MKTLEFKDSIEVLTLPELRETIQARDLGRNKQVEHFEVFDNIVSILDKNSVTYNVNPIVIPKYGQTKFIERVEEVHGKGALPALFVNKAFGSIEIPAFRNDETSVEIRIDHHDKGLSVSFGKVVLICSNGITAFRGDTASTFGNGKMKYEQVLELVAGWIANADLKNKQYDNLIFGMKSTPFISETLPEIIGDMQMKAVGQAYCSGPLAPLNISQVSSFTKDILNNQEEVKELKTVWDLYNIGTNLQKPDKMESTNIIATNLALTEYFINKFNLN